MVSVDGSGFSCVRRCGRGCWPLTGSLCWPLLVSMVYSTSVFDVVGITAGRGVGGRVSCPRPLPWRYPSGFAGVFHATVLGLGVWWSVCCLLVVVLWPLLVSMVWAMCVFEVVGVPAVRGSGRVTGRGWCRWRGTSACSSMFEGVGGLAGRRLGRLGCLLVDDLCGAGVGFSSVRGCGLRWWPLTWSSRVTVRRGLRVGEAAPRWCEAVGCWRDTKRCVIVTQHVLVWGGKHPNT